ncbi:hypothetical protein [Deinococcus marmoris]|uniref:hypothetical protein n=1 Tax=Deinococcus marmoris TaxID=249408 RepID=UPI000494E18E|nr:hypothetical protein [Deinococcus marmoris]
MHLIFSCSLPLLAPGGLPGELVVGWQSAIHDVVRPLPLAAGGGSRYHAAVQQLAHRTPHDTLRLAAFRDAPAALRDQVQRVCRPVQQNLRDAVYPRLLDFPDLPRLYRTPACDDVRPASREQVLDAASDVLHSPLLAALMVSAYRPERGSFERFVVAFALNDRRASHQQQCRQAMTALPLEDAGALAAAETELPGEDADPEAELQDVLQRLRLHYGGQLKALNVRLDRYAAERAFKAYLNLLDQEPEALQARDRRGNPHLPHGLARDLPGQMRLSTAQERQAREAFYRALEILRAER